MSREAAMAVIAGTQAEATPTVAETTQVAPSETQSSPPAQDLESSRLAMYAKKEAKLVKDRQELERSRKELEEKVSGFNPILEKGKKFEELLSTDIVEALKYMGKSDTEILNFIARASEGQAAPSPEEIARSAAADEIKKFHVEQSEKEKKAQETKNTQLVTRFKSDISKTVKAGAETLEYCNFHGPAAEDLIYETTLAILERDKELISPKEAAELVETYYAEQDKAMNTLKKRRPLIDAIRAAEETKKTEVVAAPTQRALTNRATPTAASTANGQRRETPSEKRMRLENMLRAGLRK